MPDTSMCLDTACPSRERCYRHPESGTRPDQHLQSYGNFVRVPGADRCEAFVSAEFRVHGRIPPEGEDDA